jgi:hypothetical protein
MLHSVAAAVGAQVHFVTDRVGFKELADLGQNIAALAGFEFGHCGTEADPLAADVIRGKEVSFTAIERVRAAVHPNASLYATAIACVRRCADPVQLVGATSFTVEEPREALRIEQVTFSESAREAGLCILPRINVPRQSIIHEVHGTGAESEVGAIEDQSWWYTRQGPLSALPLQVRAVSRAERSYALLFPAR